LRSWRVSESVTNRGAPGSCAWERIADRRMIKGYPARPVTVRVTRSEYRDSPHWRFAVAMVPGGRTRSGKLVQVRGCRTQVIAEADGQQITLRSDRMLSARVRALIVRLCARRIADRTT
jgi:hypothetical protein